MRIRAALRLLAVLLPLPAAAEPSCHPLTHEGRGYVICSADPATDDLRLFLRTEQGGIYGSFGRVNQALAAGGETLAFAMNAGMYHPDRRPVGLYVENGKQEMRAVAPAGPGNFGMLPNGVLCLEDGRAEVIETRTYLADPPHCRYATQSGPMLVIDGALHPRFLPDSTSRHVRNGVGVDAAGRVHFAISDAPVSFHEFARLFRDVLETPNALYFDGKVSKLYAPALGRHDAGLPMGPIVGAVVPAGD
ncbi:phosphodiester glycosidase family protein [Rhodovulum sulfidophilum]|uniref:phosphodiester glycosidase family protein n=1 Tax=Rhodovulum sulfidophilum TaxID=35806 RepID=UPI0019204B65|nr:phosphodiester glycosidase family protein [Rhodovulum sulfidophilum]